MEKLAGKRFGMIVVTKEIGEKCECKCDCGNKFISLKEAVKSGKINSCGCKKYIKNINK